MFGEVKYQKETKHLSYAEFYDGNGEMVASYSNGGWTFYGTKEENARESKLLGIYNAAWRNAAKASQENSNDGVCQVFCISFKKNFGGGRTSPFTPSPRTNLERLPGNISSVTGIIDGSAPPMEDFLL